MKNPLILYPYLLLFLLACHVVKNNPHEEEWISLFNGTDLSGWEPKIAGFEAGENYKHTFLVEDSILKINYWSVKAKDWG